VHTLACYFVRLSGASCVLPRLRRELVGFSGRSVGRYQSNRLRALGGSSGACWALRVWAEQLIDAVQRTGPKVPKAEFKRLPTDRLNFIKSKKRV
jgi:hypothetical protein